MQILLTLAFLASMVALIVGLIGFYMLMVGGALMNKEDEEAYSTYSYVMAYASVTVIVIVGALGAIASLKGLQ